MELRDLLPAGLIVVTTGIALSVGADITTDIQTGFNSTSTTQAERVAHAVSGNATSGVQEIGSWFGTIGLVLGAAVVIGVLLLAFYFRSQ